MGREWGGGGWSGSGVMGWDGGRWWDGWGGGGRGFHSLLTQPGANFLPHSKLLLNGIKAFLKDILME
jgi:hypothetical protein